VPIYKPTELHQFLTGVGTAPKRSLSQNFLIDGNILRKIVQTANLSPGEIVLEIGPGPGSLTEILLDQGAHVIAVEKDPLLAEALKRLQGKKGSLEVFCSDILTFPLEAILKERLKEGERAKVIANLPYHITTPIIVQLITLRDLLSSLSIMVQEEVARRFIALPQTSDYSSFSLFLNFFSHPRYLFTVSNTCFYPVPKVQSAMVQLVLKEPPVVTDEQKFFEMTRTAFSHRRKMLRGSLKEKYSPQQITEALIQIGVMPQARPEELSLEQWLRLFETLYAS
jgi:16S rRNA (adenine1518-N6/adenine1519-N6)-dimethyltransferase